MSSLYETQAKFYASITEESGSAEDLILDGGLLSPTGRLEIYSDAYKIRLLDVLADTFSAIHTLLGDDDFERVGLAYIESYPSSSYTLADFGHEFPSFAESNSQQQTGLMREMSEFEWDLHLLFTAQNPQPVKVEQLTNLDSAVWPELRFSLIGACHFVRFHWDVPNLWSAIRQEQYRPVEKLAEPQMWLLWRDGLETRFRSIPDAEYRALSLLDQGCSFAGMCEVVCAEEDGLEAENIAGLLQRWIDDGLFAQISRPERETEHLSVPL